MRRALGIFVRYPEPGKVKTRLTPRFAPVQAAAIYAAMVEDILGVHIPGEGHDVIVFFTPADARDDVRCWLGAGMTLMNQVGEDLGARQLNAFRDAVAAGYDRLVIIGSDCLEISPGDIRAAFDALDRTDLILGPSLDGGYYLIGAAQPYEALFVDIPWGGREVLRELLERARVAGIECELMDTKHDVDTYKDVDLLYARLRETEQSMPASNTLRVLKTVLGGGE